jgi:hypothetical protein
MRWKSRPLAGLAIAMGLMEPGAALAARATKEQAVKLAQEAYQQALARGESLSQGPCLGVIMPGWVVDIAHKPRQTIDDRPENQCAAYRMGEAGHFVELDPQGNVIRVR